MGLFKKRKRCGHCNSSKIEKGYYVRGYNSLCEQASGDDGYWCNNCWKISWVRSVEEAKAVSVDWCTVNENTTTLVIN